MSGQSGTGQLRKLFYNKHYDDQYGVRWRLSTWKVLIWMIFVTIVLVLLYSFFAPNQGAYLSNTLFLGIVTMIIIMALWMTGNIVWKSRKYMAAFILTFIILLAVYITLGFVFSFTLKWTFHYGFSTWMIWMVLAGIGATLWNDKVDRKDLFVYLLVIVVFVFGNAPVFESGGFLAQLDKFFGMIADVLSKILHPGDLIAE